MESGDEYANETNTNGNNNRNKMRKQEVERKRRMRMANALDQLKDILQENTGLDYRKSDKVEVLESTVKFLKEKKQNHHEDSFCSGYNSCLVEMSGSLMTANDIDYNTKSILLMLISKHSTTRHTAVAKKLLEDKKIEQQQQKQANLNIMHREEDPIHQSVPDFVPRKPHHQHQNQPRQQPIKYIQPHQPYSTDQQQRQPVLHRPIPVNSHPAPPTTTYQHHHQHYVPTTRRSPLTNIKNIKVESPTVSEPFSNPMASGDRGMKRSHSDTSMEKENHKRSKPDKTEKRTNSSLQRSITPSCEVQFRPIPTPSEKREFHFSQQDARGSHHLPSWNNNNCTIDNTNIAVLQKGADGKLTRISNIPLKALIGNLEVYKIKEPTTSTHSSNETKPKHKQTNEATITQTSDSKANNDNPEFSYMKLLQEEAIDPDLINTCNSNNNNEPNNNNREMKKMQQFNIATAPMGAYIINN